MPGHAVCVLYCDQRVVCREEKEGAGCPDIVISRQLCDGAKNVIAARQPISAVQMNCNRLSGCD